MLPPIERCLLLVEDDDLVRDTIALMLQEEGFDVVEACDAAEAIGLFKAGLTPAAMITDVDLGGGPNGIELADTLHWLRPDMPVIFITGRTGTLAQRPVDKREAVVPKPFESEALSRVIRQMTKARR